jgi:hypothetical protein
MKVEERDPQFLIRNGYLERCSDFEFEGKIIEAGRLGYRINRKFVTTFLGRILTAPETVFADEILRPELQSMPIFVDSMTNIIDAHRRTALRFFEDHTIDQACPPIRALLHIMAYGDYNGLRLESPEFRQLFDRKAILASGWYRERLETCQKIRVYHLRRCIQYMREFAKKEATKEYIRTMCIRKRIRDCQNRLEYISSEVFLKDLSGTIGADFVVIQ